MADIEEIRTKIDRLIRESGLNYRDVSLKIGRKDSYMQQYVKYGLPKRLKEMDRLRLAKLLNVDDAELADDELVSTRVVGVSGKAPRLLSDFIEAGSVPENPLVKIDVLPTWAETNDVGEFLNTSVGKYFISKNILDDLTSTAPEDLRILKLASDSMKPELNVGDVIWIDISCRQPEKDGLYVLMNGREPTIRRIQISPVDGSIDIISANRLYRSYKTEAGQSVSVVGKVIYQFQRV